MVESGIKNLRRNSTLRAAARVSARSCYKRLMRCPDAAAEQQTARVIVASLLSHCRDLLGNKSDYSRSRALLKPFGVY